MFYVFKKEEEYIIIKIRSEIRDIKSHKWNVKR